MMCRTPSERISDSCSRSTTALTYSWPVNESIANIPTAPSLTHTHTHTHTDTHSDAYHLTTAQTAQSPLHRAKRCVTKLIIITCLHCIDNDCMFTVYYQRLLTHQSSDCLYLCAVNHEPLSIRICLRSVNDWVTHNTTSALCSCSWLYQCVRRVVTLVMTAQTICLFAMSSLVKITVQKRHRT